ncbi:hypothetical protein HK101_011226 [Irineochytrium annulatum]|nr:hypothetical protein HK101_011226 [Irineochytrium annulatum]
MLSVTMNDPALHLSTNLTAATATSAVSLGIAQLPEPYTAMPPNVTAAYLKLGDISADWCARITSIVAALLFLSTNPMASFLSCNNGVITGTETLGRTAASLAMAVPFELLAHWVEVRVGGYDYGKGLAEFERFGFTPKAGYYVTVNMAGVLGTMLLAEAQPFMLGLQANTRCFLPGRKVSANVTIA